MKKPNENPVYILEPDEVHVLLFDLDTPGWEIQTWESLLSAEELDRSKRYRFDMDRSRFVARRGILRQLVGKYTGQDPAEVAFAVNPYGKLSVSNHALKFNLSCCQALVAFAFTLENDVGVDIEQVHPLPELAHLAERWFSPEEYAGLSDLAPELQADAFYHIWTQKEAFIKAHGEGLSWPLKDFSVSVNPNQPGRLLFIKSASARALHWKMTSYIPEAGWRVAVCLQAEADPQVLWLMPELADFMSTVTF